MKYLLWLFTLVLISSCASSNEFYFDEGSDKIISKHSYFKRVHVELFNEKDSILDAELWFAKEKGIKEVEVKNWLDYFYANSGNTDISPFMRKKYTYKVKLENISNGDKGGYLMYLNVDSSGNITQSVIPK